MSNSGKKLPTPSNIFLCGFMGSGKTTAAPMVASRLSCTSLDLDAQIEKDAGKSISRIFADEGEPRFRALETRALEQLGSSSIRQVVALGGGALIATQNRELIARLGTLIYLKASPEELERRLSPEALQRPLLQGAAGAALRMRIGQLLEERSALYASARFCIDTDKKTPEQVADLILQALSSL